MSHVEVFTIRIKMWPRSNLRASSFVLDGCACANNACTIVMRMITVTICIVVH